jgi:hypothetical protein
VAASGVYSKLLQYCPKFGHKLFQQPFAFDSFISTQKSPNTVHCIPDVIIFAEFLQVTYNFLSVALIA